MESDNQDKNWSTIQEAYATATEQWEKGKTGTDEFQSMAQFLSPKNIEKAARKAAASGKEASEVYRKEFERSMKTADRWFGEDEEKSVDNFITDFKKKGLFDVTTDDEGLWHIKTNFETTAEAAKEFGMSVDSVDTMLKALEAYGYDFSNITKSGEALHEYEGYLNNLRDTYEKMNEGDGKDRVGSLLKSFDKEYAGFKDDLSNLSEEQVVHIKFEYDLATIQSDIDSLTQGWDVTGGPQATEQGVQEYAAVIAKQGAYNKKAEEMTGGDKKGVKLPVEYELSKERENEFRQELAKNIDKLTPKEKIKLEAQISNEQKLRQGILDSFAKDHPEITPDTDTSVVQKTWNEWANSEKTTITLDAKIDKAEVDSYLSEHPEKTIKFKADYEGVEQTVKAYTDEEGTIHYYTKIDGETVEVELNKDGTIHYEADTSEPDNYKPKEKKSKVTFDKDSSAPDSYTPSNKSASVNYGVDDSAVRSFTPPNKTGTVTYNVQEASRRRQTNGGGKGGGGKGGGIKGGHNQKDGTAHANGTAFANGNRRGDWRAGSDGWALGGELGEEMVVRGGRWFTIGGNSAEFFKYRKDDIIFDANQTAQLLGKGKITHGSRRASSAFAEGTAFLRPGNKNKNTGGTGKSGGSGGGGKKSKEKSSSKKKEQSALDKFKKWFAKLFDWIEVRLERQAKRIEQFTRQAEAYAAAGTTAMAKLAKSAYANAISMASKRMDTALSGSAKYDAQAEKVLQKAMKTKKYKTVKVKKNGKVVKDKKGKAKTRKVFNGYLLSKSTAESIRQKDASGDLVISQYSSSLQEVIKDYQEWKDKSRDAIEQARQMATDIVSYYKSTADAFRDAGEKSMSYKRQLSENAKTASSKNSYIQQAVNEWDEIIRQDNAAISGLESRARSAAKSSGKSIANAKTAKSKKVKVKKKVKDKKTGKKKTVTTTKVVTAKGSAIDVASKSYKKLKKKKSGKKTIASIKSVIKKAKSTAKAGKKAIDDSTWKKIEKYHSQGYITDSFYNSCLKYQEAMTTFAAGTQELVTQRNIDEAEQKAAKIEAGSNMLENVRNEQERKVKAVQTSKALLEEENNTLKAQQDVRETMGEELNKGDYEALINSAEAIKAQSKAEENALIAQRKALQDQIAKNVALGYWSETTPEYIDAQNELADLGKEIKQCTTEQTNLNQQIQEYKNAIAKIPYNEIEKALELLDAIADYNKSLAELKESRGEDLSLADYMMQMEDNSKKISKYEQQAAQAYSDMQKAIAASGDPGKQVYGGKTADEYRIMYNQAMTEINNLKGANEELKDSLRDDVYWRTYERAHDAAKRLLDVVSGIADLISDDMYFKNGKLTEFGVAQVANLTKQYELASQEVRNYSDDIENLNDLLSRGEYTNEEYKEKLAELQSGLLDAAQSMKGYMNEIMDMYKDLDQAELDALFKLIDARSEALQKKKEYYDYDKTIKDKTRDIQELTAQIAALDGISTAEAKAQRAKLQEQLSKEQEDLEDTEREHYFNMMQDGLTDLKDTLQDQFDEKWDNLSQDLAAMIQLMTDAKQLSETSSSRIADTLDKLLAFYGINASETGIRGVNRNGIQIDGAYASGARRIRGSHIGLSNESGTELLVTKNGLISHFKPGDGVVPADLTARLYELAQSVKPGSSLGRANISGLSAAMGTTINQTYGSLVNIEGSADAATVSDLKRMSKDLLEKSYNYTSQRMHKDYLRTGGLRRA